MKRPIVLVAAVVAVALLGGLGGAYVYFFSGLRSAPTSLAGTKATPSASGEPSATSASTLNLVGNWTVMPGSSLVGYRVKEQFAGQSSSHEAVARTSAVSGGLTIQQTNGGLQASAIKFTAQLAGLQSVDQVAGFNVSQRDRVVSRSLAVDQFPDATFQAQTIGLPASVQKGGAELLTVPGQLTIHGVTRPVQAAAQLQTSGSQAQATGSTTFNMTDFGITPPHVPITTVEPGVVLDFKLVLTRA
jgi:polyisoprenoid-binding protein YceI